MLQVQKQNLTLKTLKNYTMEFSQIIELFSFTFPAIVTGLVALYFFKLHTTNEEKRRIFLLRKEKQNIALPIRLQAYERLALFLERISPPKLILRVTPSGTKAIDYQNKLVSNIQQEFEHNLAQQIYVTTGCWNALVTAKNATIQIIRTAAANVDVETADQLSEKIIESTLQENTPTNLALSYLKNEVKKQF